METNVYVVHRNIRVGRSVGWFFYFIVWRVWPMLVCCTIKYHAHVKCILIHIHGALVWWIHKPICYCCCSCKKIYIYIYIKKIVVLSNTHTNEINRHITAYVCFSFSAFIWNGNTIYTSSYLYVSSLSYVWFLNMFFFFIVVFECVTLLLRLYILRQTQKSKR